MFCDCQQAMIDVKLLWNELCVKITTFLHQRCLTDWLCHGVSLRIMLTAAFARQCHVHLLASTMSRRLVAVGGTTATVAPTYVTHFIYCMKALNHLAVSVCFSYLLALSQSFPYTPSLSWLLCNQPDFCIQYQLHRVSSSRNTWSKWTSCVHIMWSLLAAHFYQAISRSKGEFWILVSYHTHTVDTAVSKYKHTMLVYGKMLQLLSNSLLLLLK